MKPVNTKSLLAFLFAQMENLNNKVITPNEAMAQAKLASQACNLLNYELKRSIVEMKLEQMGHDVQSKLRDIESLAFDDAKSQKTIEYND